MLVIEVEVSSLLLGSLLLLLLLLLCLSLLWFFSRSSFLHWRRSLFFLLLLLDCHKESNDILGLNHIIFINFEFSEDIVNLCFCHFVSPGLEGVGKHLRVNLSLELVSLECLYDEVITVVSLSGHLLLEHVDHVVRSARAADLPQQAVQLSLRHEDTNIVESSPQVVLVDGTILVDVHQLEAVLVHLLLLVRETALILTLSHFYVFLSPLLEENSPC